MRLLARNKQTIYYRNLISAPPITTTDEYGNTLETGEFDKTYGEIKSVRAYVKSAIGENAAEPFGDFTTKRRTIYIEPNKADFNEFSLLWVGISPEQDEETGEPTVDHNFTIDGIAYGINHNRVAIRQVEVRV